VIGDPVPPERRGDPERDRDSDGDQRRVGQKEDARPEALADDRGDRAPQDDRLAEVALWDAGDEVDVLLRKRPVDPELPLA
jgi:hypothetical protein